MNPQPLASFISELKGAPLSIYLMMLRLDRPTGSEELALFTRYSAHTVRTGLKRLAFIGLARRQGRYQGWVLTAKAYRHGRQLLGIHAGMSQPSQGQRTNDAHDDDLHAGYREGDESAGDVLVTDIYVADTDVVDRDVADTDVADETVAGEANVSDVAPPELNAPSKSRNSAASSPPEAPAPETSVEREEENVPVPAGRLEPAGESGRPAGHARVDEDPHERKFSPVDRGKLSLPPCSCSYTHGSSLSSFSRKDTKPSHHEQLTTTWGPDRQNPPVAPPQRQRHGSTGESQAEAAVEKLQSCGCPTRMAQDAVERAMAHGWRGAEVLEAVDGWFAYAESPEGRTIRHKGFFTMSRLRIGQAAPEVPPASDSAQSAAARDAMARAYIEAQYQRIVQH